ncbi:heat shock-like protein [Trypanosoma rangeli]|uniref:Heat shock-like protein n=1 Tax=Trypanosoma rangeli TaxID=5698 RepID=A0A422NK91_TRYRA|nr:heat shock-like protein [Trypanosoma rangeli]RNF05893.1 heat shock-like protein [Trypanosoma rangeli]|eukprot:RNF05893.1 heat shock-like protein [Trypanosoma rangeli]
MFVDYYALLSLPPSCSAKDVRDAFKRLVLLCHPDRPDEGSTECFCDIKDAYDVLSDPTRRYLYDLGYAEVKEMQQRQRQAEQALKQQQRREMEGADELMRKRTVQPQPPRNGAQAPTSVYSDVIRRVPSSGNSSRVLCTPLSNSHCTLTPGCGRQVRGAVKKSREMAAQAIPRQGSGLAAVRRCRLAELERSGAGIGDKNTSSCPNHQTVDRSSPPDVRFLHPPTSQSSHNSSEAAAGYRQSLEQEPKLQPWGARSSVKKNHGVNWFIVPKVTTLQWGEDNLMPRRSNNIPVSDCSGRNVIKTWKIFFHVPGIAKEEP